MLRAYIYKANPDGTAIIPGTITKAYQTERTLWRYGVWPVFREGVRYRVETVFSDRMYAKSLKVTYARNGELGSSHEVLSSVSPATSISSVGGEKCS